MIEWKKNKVYSLLIEKYSSTWKVIFYNLALGLFSTFYVI